MAITHVLVVGSAPTLGTKSKRTLERTQGLCVETVIDLREVLSDKYAMEPDFIVIDLNSDFINGFELTDILHFRQNAAAKPLLMLRRRHRDDSGDCEQAAIDNAVLRKKLSVVFNPGRSHPQVWELARYRDDHLIADFSAGRYWVDGRSVQLTRREQALLRLMVERLERVVPRAEVLERLWGYETRSLDTHIRSLRIKLGIQIETLPGFGYRFSPRGAAQVSREPDAYPTDGSEASVFPSGNEGEEKTRCLLQTDFR